MTENILTPIHRFLYKVLVSVGRPLGGLRPRRIYDIMGRLAYPTPSFEWWQNRWGAEFYLSPSYHIDRNMLLFGTYDEGAHLMIEKLLRPGMVCMDVGANLGEMAIHMASKVGPSGVVYAFEPVASAYKRLCMHIARNRMDDTVQPIQMALSDITGIVQIHFSEDTADNQGLGSIVQTKSRSLPLTEDIRTTTIDEFVAREQLRRIDLIKIDIQGAELPLLDGGTRVFGEISPDLLIEISPEDLRGLNKTSQDLLARIESYGYQVYQTSKGQIGSRILASRVKPTFRATNVYCTKKPCPCSE